MIGKGEAHCLDKVMTRRNHCVNVEVKGQEYKSERPSQGQRDNLERSGERPSQGQKDDLERSDVQCQSD